jgi:hypothetical protein
LKIQPIKDAIRERQYRVALKLCTKKDIANIVLVKVLHRVFVVVVCLRFTGVTSRSLMALPVRRAERSRQHHVALLWCFVPGLESAGSQQAGPIRRGARTVCRNPGM